MNSKQLMSSILQQAMQGQLVPQLDTEPEVAQVGPAPAPDAVPFAIPPKWKWVFLEQICTYIQRGKSPKYSEIKLLPVIAQKCNQWDGLHMELALFVDPATISSYHVERFLQQGDVLVNSTGLGTIGRVGSYDPAVNPYEQAVADSHVTVIRANIALAQNSYIKHVLSSSLYQATILNAARGSTKQKELALATVKQLPIPLPPLEEQRRIVAKLEEIRPLVESLGEAQEQLAQLEADFPRKLKASLLQQAISGQLVPQLDTEPEVAQLGPAPAPDVVPFALPPKWKWARMDEVAQSIRYGYTASAGKSGNAKLLRITDIKDGDVNWGEVPFCDISTDDLAKFKLSLQDILIARSGATVGKSFVVDKLDIGHECVFASYLIRIRLKDGGPLLSSYIKYYLLSPVYWQGITSAARGSAQPNVNAKQLANLLIPLPPLDEQRRIVAKLDELLPEVDKLDRLLKLA